MESDPWADAPPSPRPSTPVKADTSPSKPNISSPLTHRPISPSSASSSAYRVPTPPPVPVSSTEGDDMDMNGSEEIAVVGITENASEEPDAFDDFDDFDQPAAGPSSPKAADGDDAFGDFGDFEEGDFDEPEPEPPAAPAAVEPEESAERWHALRLRPMPTKADLLDQLTELLSPLMSGTGTEVLTDDPPRQTGGLQQILVTESSREVYAQLTTPPMLKALDWTRSRVRRDHLISMGIPVNLDEVESHRLSSLPPLRITTGAAPPLRRQSADESRYTAQQKGKGRELAQSVPASAGGMGNGEVNKKYGLGQRPMLDITKAEDLCGIEEDRLSLWSVEKLRAMQDELVATSANASALLAWSLQYKDAQTQDSATYNGMISELIANAAKAKSAQNVGSGGVFRRASTKQRPMSASATPRVGSPAMR